MTISDVVAQRGINEVVHFTTEKGLTGCCATNTVLSRARLDKTDYLSHIASPVSEERKEAEITFDKEKDWLDYVNLSISEINTHYYQRAKRWFRNREAWWCILSFSPEILEHPEVCFSTTNNIYTGTIRSSGAQGLLALFSSPIVRWRGVTVSRKDRANNLTTCEQAEVLYPGALNMSYLRKVYAINDEQAASIHGTLHSLGFCDVDVIIEPSKFYGMPNV